MLIIPPPPFRRPRQRAGPPLPPSPTTAVVEVRLLDEMSLVWFFSGPVTITGPGPGDPPCPQLEANDGGDGWVGAVAVEQYDDAALIAYYPSGTALAVGDPYRIVAPPDNLAFAPAAPLALPQTGAVTEWE